MKIDVRQPLLDYRGVPIIEGENRTFRDFLSIGLTQLGSRDEVLTGEHKALAHQILKKLYGSNKVDLTGPEREYAKERCLKTLPIVHAGRIMDILDDIEAMPILTGEELAADSLEDTKNKLAEMDALPKKEDKTEEPKK